MRFKQNLAPQNQQHEGNRQATQRHAPPLRPSPLVEHRSRLGLVPQKVAFELLPLELIHPVTADEASLLQTLREQSQLPIPLRPAQPLARPQPTERFPDDIARSDEGNATLQRQHGSNAQREQPQQGQLERIANEPVRFQEQGIAQRVRIAHKQFHRLGMLGALQVGRPQPQDLTMQLQPQPGDAIQRITQTEVPGPRDTAIREQPQQPSQEHQHQKCFGIGPQVGNPEIGPGHQRAPVPIPVPPDFGQHTPPGIDHLSVRPGTIPFDLGANQTVQIGRQGPGDQQPPTMGHKVRCEVDDNQQGGQQQRPGRRPHQRPQQLAATELCRKQQLPERCRLSRRHGGLPGAKAGRLTPRNTEPRQSPVAPAPALTWQAGVRPPDGVVGSNPADHHARSRSSNRMNASNTPMVQ